MRVAAEARSLDFLREERCEGLSAERDMVRMCEGGEVR